MSVATAAFRRRAPPGERARRLSVAGMLLVTLLIALPLSLALRGMIEAHLGRSLAADAAAAGVDYDWWQEFSAQATGLGTTFVPSILGFGAVLDNISGLLDNKPLAATIAGVTTRVVDNLVVPVRRRTRSLRPRPSDAGDRIFRGVRHAFLALREARA